MRIACQKELVPCVITDALKVTFALKTAVDVTLTKKVPDIINELKFAILPL